MGKLHKKLHILAAVFLALTMFCACGKEPNTPITVVQTTPPDAAAVPTPAASTPAPAPAPAPTETPEPRAERVDDSYFADAAFFGNSLMDGLHSFGGLDYGAFFAGTSASVISVKTILDAKLSDGTPATMLDALVEEQYAKIYVLLGINELGFNKASFVELYAELLGDISRAEPDAQLYVLSLTPITEQRSHAEDVFTRERVMEYNAAIRTMAEENGYIYLDLFDALSDDNGWLPQRNSSDGVHFTADTYLDWAEYLRRNYDGAAERIAFYKENVSKPVVSSPSDLG